jgi:hypothetical protein
MSLSQWAHGPYGPGCGEPSWKCKKCEAWTDDPRNDLATCPKCGFTGEKPAREFITITGPGDPRKQEHVPDEPLHLFVNGTYALYREFTVNERMELLKWTYGTLQGDDPIRYCCVVLLDEVRPGDDLTYTNLAPGFNELWVRFTHRDRAGATRIGNMRLCHR